MHGDDDQSISMNGSLRRTRLWATLLARLPQLCNRIAVRSCRCTYRFIQAGLAAGQGHLHLELAVRARRYDEYAGLFGEIPSKAHRICHPMPRLDTDEGRAGFAPEAQVGRIRKLQGESRTH